MKARHEVAEGFKNRRPEKGMILVGAEVFRQVMAGWASMISNQDCVEARISAAASLATHEPQKPRLNRGAGLAAS